MKALKFLRPIMALCIFAGCSDKNFLDSNISEGSTIISSDISSIRVLAASFSTSEKISESLEFLANYNWKASSEESWLCLSKDSDINLSGVSKKYIIPFELEENADALPRTGVVSITSADKKLNIEIIQEGFSPVLELKSDSVISTPCEGGEFKAVVYSNSKWSAKVKDGGDAEIKNLSPASGNKSGEFSLVVGSNLDEEKGKTATIVVSAEGCEDIYITINQAKYKA